MNKPKPLISVVMPVFNAGEFLVESIESILKQTFQDFEFIIVDDASTDNSWKILKQYALLYPKKIKIFRNKTNQKAAITVNKAIKHARGLYIARMDADDIAHPLRLEKQLAYLRSHPQTVAVGAQCFLIDRNAEVIGEKRFPITNAEITSYIFKFCPLQQPSIMIARYRLPKTVNLYDHNMSPVEDVEFLFKLFRYGKVENMPELLHYYRIHANNSSLKNFKKSFFLTLISRIRGITHYGCKPSVSAVITTLAQCAVVFLLPDSLTFLLYRLIKKIQPKESTLLAPSPKAFAKVSVS